MQVENPPSKAPRPSTSMVSLQTYGERQVSNFFSRLTWMAEAAKTGGSASQLARASGNRNKMYISVSLSVAYGHGKGLTLEPKGYV